MIENYPINSMSVSAYIFTTQYKGTAEVPGEGNNSMIAAAHHLTGRSAENPTKDVDSTIPWCSSWMNLAVVCAGIRANPGRMFDILVRRELTTEFIRSLFLFAGIPFEIWYKHDTGREIIEPTWSAASRSWDEWGAEVPLLEAKRGDIVRLTRDGGGHVAFLDEDVPGFGFVRLLGGNQNDKVCSASFLKTRIVTVRRSNI